MKEVFEKIIEKLNSKKAYFQGFYECEGKTEHDADLNKVTQLAFDEAIEIVKQASEEYSNGWIPCSEQMPPVETEVFIVAKRKYRGGEVRYITTTAMYEDGTVLENDSCWYWQDIDGEWDEENDCYIIPEGWWEYRHYNPDDVYNNVIDDEVIAWQPLPEPYQPKGDKHGNEK